MPDRRPIGQPGGQPDGQKGPPDPTRPKFYGRRKGRALNATQQDALDNSLPRHLLHIDRLAGPATLFDKPVTALWMEVGFGSGEHLLAQAQAHPDIGLIGCEPFLNGVAKLARDIEAASVDTIKVYPDDARHVLDALPDESVSRIFVLFPDPWPKKRHNMRRFIGPENLPRLARVLTDGGELRCATDHPDYLDWMLYHAGQHPDFTWLAERPSDWQQRPKDQPPTRYETKALAGRPHYLRFRRKSRS